MDFYVIVISYVIDDTSSDVAKPELVCEFEGTKLAYVIDNAYIQLSRMLKYAGKKKIPYVTIFRTDRSTRLATQAYLKDKWYSASHHSGARITDRIALLDIARADLQLDAVTYQTIYHGFVYNNNNNGGNKKK